MGTEPQSVGLGDVLFPKGRRRVFEVLLGNPDRDYYFNELLEMTGAGKGGLKRELDALTRVGIIDAQKVGNQKRYRANENSPIFNELRSIVRKTFGLADVLREALLPLASKIAVAFVYGSVAKQTDTSRSDIDLLVVSDTVSYQELFAALGQCESRIGRKINPTLFEGSEFSRRRTEGNTFLLRVLEQPKLLLIGEIHELGKSDEDKRPESGTPGER